MFGRRAPDTENTTGARWNPAGVPAIYLSLTEQGATAEGDHAIAVQPLRPRVRRVLYPVQLTLANVLDLSDPGQVTDLTGLTAADITDDDHAKCREIGAAADWLEHDGLLVPSARSAANNLVVFPSHRPADAAFEAGPGVDVAT